LNADGSDRNVVFRPDMPIFGMTVCPDGEHVLFIKPNKQTRALNIYRFDVASGKADIVTSGKLDQNPACSPDSTFFLYTTLVNGKKLLMRAPLQGGQARQLSDDYVEFAAVSPDGQQIAELGIEGNGVQTKSLIRVIPANGGAPIKTVEPNPQLSGFFQYSDDGKSIYYPITEKGVSNLIKQTLDGGALSPATNFKELTIRGYAYNWQAHQLAVTRGKLNSDVVVITQQAAQ
jgi:Tol biopolymer transport system component